MYSTKKKLTKANSVRIFYGLGCIVVGIFLFAMFDSSLWRYLTTSKNLLEYPAEVLEYNEAYILENEMLIDWFAETDDARLYVMPVSDLMDETAYMALYLEEEDFELADRQIEATWKFLETQDESSYPTETMTKKVIVDEMDETEKELFDSYFEGSDVNLIYNVAYAIGIKDAVFARYDFTDYIYALFIIVIIGAGIYELLSYILGLYKKPFEKRMDELGCDYDSLDQAMEESTELKKFDIGKKYIVSYGHKSSLVKCSDIVWIYKNVTNTRHMLYGVIPTGTTKSYELRIMDKYGEMHKISANEKQIDDCLLVMEEYVPFAIMGYTDEIATAIARDFRGVVEEVERRKGNMAQSGNEIIDEEIL